MLFHIHCNIKFFFKFHHVSEVKRKTVHRRTEQQQMAARPRGSDQRFLGMFIISATAPSVQGWGECGGRAAESLAPTKDRFPTLLHVTGFLCESKRLLLK